MSRGVAISAGIVAALVVTAVAIGAASEVRIHRLHLPPPPSGGQLGSDQPPPPGTTSPPQPASPPAPPGSQPPPPPAPPAPPAPPPPPAVGCTTGGGATPDATGTLADYTLSLSATTFSSGATLTFRGSNVGADLHTIAIKAPGAPSALCGTGIVPSGGSSTFTVTGLPPGGYVVYCTIHPTVMHVDITVG